MTAQAKASQKYQFNKMLGQAGAYLILGAWSLFTILAISWVVMSSFKTTREIFQHPLEAPQEIQVENYATAWNATNMQRYSINSIIIVSTSVFLILAVSAPAAYVLSRVNFRGAATLTLFFTAGMGIPFPLLFIPLFSLLSKLGLINTIPGLVLVYVSLSLPFTIFILTGFFVTLPSQLEEAAIVDGATDYQVFWKIMLPLASPGLLTAAIFNFIGLWNEFQLALVFANDESTRPLSLGLYTLRNALQYTGDWASMFAGVVIVMVPTIVVYLLLSERMIAGITMGSSK